MRQRRAAAMSSARAAREREQRRGKGSRESARGFQGVAWSCGRRPGEEEAARQGGGGRGAWPRAPGACPSSWQRRKATGEGGGGGLGQREELASWAGYR